MQKVQKLSVCKTLYTLHNVSEDPGQIYKQFYYVLTGRRSSLKQYTNENKAKKYNVEPDREIIIFEIINKRNE